MTTIAAPAVVRSPDWTQAERHLRKTGLHACAPAAAEARQRGLSASDLIVLTDFYLANRNAWKEPGAIFHAIRQWLPGDHPASKENDYWSIWPTPTASWVKRRSAANDPAPFDRNESDASNGHFAEWERRYGATLNALTHGELNELLKQTSLAPWSKKWAKQPLGPLPRQVLLRFLATQASPEART